MLTVEIVRKKDYLTVISSVPARQNRAIRRKPLVDAMPSRG
jgi:hypothetical protein